jgi:dienelactone hydrolase
MSEFTDYTAGSVTAEAYVALPEGAEGKRPCVIVCHAWAGQTDYERGHADRLAGLGYVAIAADVYGKGKRGNTVEENTALLQPMLQDRAELLRRLLDTVALAKAHPAVDASRIAAIGFCFGGLSVLDIARSGTPDVKGVVCLHGIFGKPELGPQGTISAKVLVLHGYDDPMAKPEEMIGLASELTDAGADWQIHAYGGTVHAFTNPHAAMPDMGLAYSAKVTRRALAATDDFLAEVFGG